MENLTKYQIVFQGLSEGVHSFKFDIDDKFFESLEYSDIQKGNLTANVKLTKRSQFLELNFTIKGIVELICDRCLDEYKQDITYNGVLYVKFTEQESDELPEDVMFLSPNESEVDISHYLYESIKLSIPIKTVHPEDEEGNLTCNPKMIEKLNKYKNTGKTSDNEVDPRWRDLANLIGNNN